MTHLQDFMSKNTPKMGILAAMEHCARPVAGGFLHSRPFFLPESFENGCYDTNEDYFHGLAGVEFAFLRRMRVCNILNIE